MKKIILASSSLQRKLILAVTGLQFEVVPSTYEEDHSITSDPIELVKLLSKKKGENVAKKYKDAIIISADQVIVKDNQIFGKPHTSDVAIKMLKALNGGKHSVITAFTIIDTFTNRSVTRVVTSDVFFKKCTEDEIKNYVLKDKPLDHAGGYKIQSLGAVLIEKIEGDYFNIVGLPLSALVDELKSFGIQIL